MALRTPGRGARFDPPNRFEARSFEPMEIDVPCEDDEPRSLKTSYFRDLSKSILSENDSPDIGFTYSINPYRGCEHGCVYCLGPDTPILHADLTWKPIGSTRIGDELIGFDELCEPGFTRKFRPAVVEAVVWSKRPTLHLKTEHSEVVTTAEHRWLQARSSSWSRTAQLSPGSLLRRFLVAQQEPFEEGCRAGDADSPVAVARKTRTLLGRAMKTVPATVLAIEPGPVAEVVDIQTSTRTFFAAGLATHNCYARPTHEYLGFSSGLDFESKIVVKENAPELLRAELSKKSWVPQVVCMSGNTDCYQPAERELRITRRCLEVFLEFRNPVGVITKNGMVARDADVLSGLAKRRLVHVTLSITTLDPGLARAMEPRASMPSRRLEAIRALAAAGVPVGVNVAPVIPGLTDDEMPAILKAARDAGATSAGMTIVRLPHGVEPLFLEWLQRERPERASKVLARLRDVRGGALSDSRFGSRQRGEGEVAAMIAGLFERTCDKLGFDGSMRFDLDTSAFSRPGEKQGELFRDLEPSPPPS